MNRLLTLSAALAACVAVSACSTLNRLNPFGGDDGPQAVASEGERIPILALDTRLTPADTLAGQDFYLPEAAPVAAWPLPGGTPAQSVEHAAAAPAFQIAWRRGIGEGSGRKSFVTAPPVALDGKIYTMDGEARVVASDARTGARLWETDAAERTGRDKEAFGGGLAVSDGKVIVSSGFRFVAALDAATGRVLWRTKVDAPVHAAPTIFGSRAFATDVDNEIRAFDLNTGEILWSYQAIVEPARILRASSPAVDGEAVIAPFSSGELVALRAVNGNALWTEVLSRTSRTSALSEIRDIPGRPAIYRGDVYAVSHSGVFAAIDVRTGQRRWELPVSSINSAWPAGDAVFVVSQAGEAMAINRDSGQVYWVTDLGKGRGYSEGGVLGLYDRSAKPIWTGPVLASGRLIFVSDRGEAVALNPKTGAEVGVLKLGDAAFIAPIAYGDMLYLVTDEGDLVAIR
ncbi:MAG TPA: PQQ-binding-like beta-propeller repeat protein [Caulobacteraceae bacterium]|nr:PQQ-binding-like beta-propeller repeat protein [Caulobacteraceae bacterium]